jgi:aminoglycoside phosphotransferase (APT) family kinase protein
MVAAVAPDPQSLFNRVRTRVETRCAELWGEGARLTCARRMFSTPEGFALLLAGGRIGSLIVRIPLNARTTARFQRNFDALARLNRGLRRLDTPAPLLAEDVVGTPFFVESMVHGDTLRSCLDPQWEDTALAGAIEWIGDLHRATSIPRVLSDTELTALVSEPVAAAFRFIGRPDDDPDCVALRQYLVASLTGHRLPLVFAHGDYSVDNVLVDSSRARVSGVFDWDLSSDRSLPLLDVYYLLISAALAARGGSFGQRFAEALEGRLWNPSMEEAIRQYCTALAIPDALRLPLLALTWVFHLAVRIQNPEPYRWPSVETDLASPVLEVLLNRIASASAGERLREIA